MDWDVFISHAAEDKDAIARPLANALREAGYRVWYDEFTLGLGDGLVRSIDRGLAGSRYGIVIVSPSFLAKDWPRRELDGLVTREIGRGKVVLPVWHGVTHEDIERFSPPLADKLGVSTARGLDEVVAQVRQVLDGGTAPTPAGPRPGARRRGLLVAGGAVVAAAAGSGLWWWRRERAAARARLDGRWRIDARDDLLRSTLDLKVTDGGLEGSVEIHYPDFPEFVYSGLHARRRAIVEEGRWDGEQLSFVTRRTFRRALDGDPTETTQLIRYRGRLEDGRLLLTLQFMDEAPVEAEAHRPWPLPASRLLASLAAPARTSVEALQALPGGRVAAVYGAGTMRLWRIDEGGAAAGWTQWQFEGAIAGLVPWPQDRLLVVLGNGRLFERDLPDSDAARELPRLPTTVAAVQELADGQLALAQGANGILLWKGGETRPLRVGQELVRRLARLPDGRLVSGEADGAVRLWTSGPGRVDRTLLEGGRGTSGPRGLFALPDGRVAVGATPERPPMLLDPAGARPAEIGLGGPTAWSTLLGTTTDGQVLVVDSRRLVSRWSPADGSLRTLVDFNEDDIAVDAALSLSPTRLLLGRRDGSLQLWAVPG